MTMLKRWWPFIQGAWLTVASGVLICMAIDMRADGIEANRAAAKSCVRTMTAAPYHGEFFRRYRVYPPEIQEWLTRDIPKSCPAVPASEMPPEVTTPWPLP